MSKSQLVQAAYTAIVGHFIEYGRAPHYIELAKKFGISPDTARELQREAAESEGIGA